MCFSIALIQIEIYLSEMFLSSFCAANCGRTTMPKCIFNSVDARLLNLSFRMTFLRQFFCTFCREPFHENSSKELLPYRYRATIYRTHYFRTDTEQLFIEHITSVQIQNSYLQKTLMAALKVTYFFYCFKSKTSHLAKEVIFHFFWSKETQEENHILFL